MGYRALLVLSALIIAISIGLRQSLGLYMPPMTAALGITAATFGFAIAVQNIVWGFSQPVIGAIADRYGPRPVLVGTALMYAGGLVLMAFSKSVPGGLQIGGVLAGIGTAGTGFGVLIGTVSRATPAEKRTRTVGTVAAAASLGTFAIAPLGQALIETFGWKGALFAFAGLAASMAALALGVRESSTTARASGP